jgi:ABC-2 type transport system ATP-binding protein
LSERDALVSVVGLVHRYGAVNALDGVTFDVPQATLCAMLGPNGSGKTTLFRVLTTMLTPQGGSARVAGADVVAERQRVRRAIGVVFQKPSLDGKLTVLENLRHHGLMYGLRGSQLRAQSLLLLERFGIADRAGARVETLSGGMQRRVELAKGLLHRPKVLILDEPSTGLDPAARTALMKFLHELRDRDGVTCLLTTHLMDEADRCDQVAVMDRGKLAALDSPARLKARVGGDVLTIHSERPKDLAEKMWARFGLRGDVAENTVRVEKERGHEFVPQLVEAFRGEIEAVAVAKPTLEDVFFHVTGHEFEERADYRTDSPGAPA